MPLELLMFTPMINWDRMKGVGKIEFYAEALLNKQFGENGNDENTGVD